MKIGIGMPLGDIGGTSAIVREYAQTAEAMGYDHLCLTDHVLGVNAASRPDWGNRNTSADFFHDPFVLMGFLAAATKTIEFSTQVLVLAQRQAVLVAKQAACVDVLAGGGRVRLGVGIGWNEAEFIGLNENFRNRGRRSEEQVAVMQALWAEPHVTFNGKYHIIPDAGINPLPAARRIPVWFGGHMDVTLQRIARMGDGWMMLSHPPGAEAAAEFDKLRRMTEAAGRDPAAIGLEVWTSVGDGTAEDWRAEFLAWKALGVTHITLNNTFTRGIRKRIAGRSMAAHLEAMQAYFDAVRELR